jgi:RNA polymerase sigma-70 factor (ECF subfamily)
MLVLERLTPAERAAFVLHDVFQLPFERIAEIVGRTPQACRQLASRARHRVASAPASRSDVSPGEALRVATGFAVACETGDLEALTELLDPTVQGLFDSGGHVPNAPNRVVTGAGRVAAILVDAFKGSGALFRPAGVNGGPGVVVKLGGAVVSVISLDVAAGLITHVHGIGNPEKLRHLVDSDAP